MMKLLIKLLEKIAAFDRSAKTVSEIRQQAEGVQLTLPLD